VISVVSGGSEEEDKCDNLTDDSDNTEYEIEIELGVVG